MTPTQAMTHLQDLIEEQGTPFGVLVQPWGVNLTRGICPWDIGLTLQVDNPDQREIITQKIIAYVKTRSTDLNLRQDDAGHAYFYESRGYRFTDERGIPTAQDQYPDHAAYRYVLIKEEAEPPEPPQPVPKAEPQLLPAPQPMTPEAAITHLRLWVKEQKKEHGMAFGVTVFSGGPVWLRAGACPWEIGLRLIVDIPEQFGAIKQKIEEHAAEHFTELVLKKDAEGNAYFYEERGYRFVDADDFPSSVNQYPQHGDYHYVLIKAEIPVSEPIAAPPQPRTEALPETTTTFEKAQTCRIAQFFARIWSCVSQAFASLVRCLSCRGKKPFTPDHSLS